MSETNANAPFKELGRKLEKLRTTLNETLADVSGAVEIDEPMLQRMEQGHVRPSEDILMLLISHFDMREDDAVGLWQLAGYDKDDLSDMADFLDNDDAPSHKNTLVVMASDPRVIYSDNVQVTATNTGVVVTFGQAGGNPQTVITSRIGMSREQASIVIRAIQDALNHSGPQRLNEGTKPNA